MPRTATASLSPPPEEAAPTKRRKITRDDMHEGQPKDPVTPIDEFQQVTLPEFVSAYKLEEMGYGGDVYYQPDVSLCPFAT